MSMKRTLDAEILQAALAAGWPRPTPDQERELSLRCFSQYLFYETTPDKKARRCICTSCDSWFWMEKSRDKNFWKQGHKSDGICPRCGEEVRYLAMGRFRSFATINERRHVVLFRYIEGRGLFALAAVAHKEYDPDDLCPPVIMEEKKLYLFQDGKVGCLKWTEDWTGLGITPTDKPIRTGWSPMATVGEPFQADPYFGDYDGGYYVFGTDELMNSPLRYCGYDAYLTDCQVFEEATYHRGLMTYLAEYTQRPQLEFLAKLGLRGIIDDLLNGRTNGKRLNWKGKSLAALLKLTKAEAKAYLRMGGSLDDLDAWRAEGQERPGLKLAEYLETLKILGGASNRKRAADLSEGLDLKLSRVLRYLDGQRGRDRNAANALHMWDDYLAAARRLDLDLTVETVALPKDLRERHDNAVRQVSVMESVEAAKSYRRRLKGLRKKFEFELDGLLIRVPASGREIIAEGKRLRHCVGGYADRHMTGKVVILFLRRAGEPDTSYVTIELEGRNWDQIRQIHGYGNERVNGKRTADPKETHKAFLDAWLSWVQSGSARDKQGRPIIKEENEVTVA